MKIPGTLAVDGQRGESSSLLRSGHTSSAVLGGLDILIKVLRPGVIVAGEELRSSKRSYLSQ
jgi:hypothetical protein